MLWPLAGGVVLPPLPRGAVLPPLATVQAPARWSDGAAPARVERFRLPFGPSAPLLEILHAPTDAETARRLGRAAAAFDPRLFSGRDPAVLAAAAGAAAADTVRLLLAPDEPTFRRASGGRSPDWGLAVAFPGSAEIVMRSPRLGGGGRDPRQVLAHELVHVYLALALGPAAASAPRWFHEGLASLLAGEWGWSERLDLVLALLAGRPLSLQSLEHGFPEGRSAAELAYLQSLAAAAYLRDLSGEEGLRVLVRNLRRLGDFDAALRRTYGLTYGELEERLARHLSRRFGWAGAAASSWAVWTPLAVGVVLLVLLRRARYRSRLRELHRRERLQPEDLEAEWRLGEEAWEEDRPEGDPAPSGESGPRSGRGGEPPGARQESEKRLQ